MNILETKLPGVLIIEPSIFTDDRGYFFESYNRERYSRHGISNEFVQDNLSCSVKNTLRGLHYQFPHSQAKLVHVVSGEVFDVAVDIRTDSPAFGQWTGVILSSENKKQLYIPKGFAHGFCVLSDTAVFFYKCDDFYAPDCEGGVLWSDLNIGIKWPVKAPLLSDKDDRFPCLEDVPQEQLPVFPSIQGATERKV